jgi:hypothetical protein
MRRRADPARPWLFTYWWKSGKEREGSKASDMTSTRATCQRLPDLQDTVWRRPASNLHHTASVTWQRLNACVFCNFGAPAPAPFGVARSPPACCRPRTGASRPPAVAAGRAARCAPSRAAATATAASPAPWLRPLRVNRHGLSAQSRAVYVCVRVYQKLQTLVCGQGALSWQTRNHANLETLETPGHR